MNKLAEGKDKIFEQLIEAGILTREEIKDAVAEHNELMSQTVPWNGGARLAPINSTKSNHAVGECYKPHSKLNIHDPDNKYVWADEKTLLCNCITLVGGALGALGFITGIYCLVFLGMLL